MKLLLITLFTLTSSLASAAGGSMFGFNAGFGLPYLSQFGVNYVHSSHQFSAELSYNTFGISVGSVGVGMSKAEVSLRWHPFGGSYFVGAGLGKQTMYAKGTEIISGQSVETKIDVSSNALTPMMGWMWGMGDGGFYAGLDFGFQNPSGAVATITTNADASIQATPEYQQLITETADQSKKYGETGFVTLTFLRLGYLF